LSGKKLYKTQIDKKIQKIRLSKKGKTEGLVVSLTSYGERINDLKYTLHSLVNQSLQPEKIIVWLSKEKCSLENLLKDLLQFQNYGVEFSFCEDIRSYTKLVPALEKYPDKIIAIADDDIYYHKNWLKKLWLYHLKNPDIIAAHLAHQVCFSPEKTLLPYTKWKHDVASNKIRYDFFPTGVGGVLYQKRLLHEDVCKKDLFLKLSPYADDVWFYFMIILAKTKVAIVSHPFRNLKYVDIYKEYGLNNKNTLQNINVQNNKNDEQIKSILDFYGITESDFAMLIQ
jgi:hypothetical protein